MQKSLDIDQKTAQVMALQVEILADIATYKKEAWEATGLSVVDAQANGIENKMHDGNPYLMLASYGETLLYLVKATALAEKVESGNISGYRGQRSIGFPVLEITIQSQTYLYIQMNFQDELSFFDKVKGGTYQKFDHVYFVQPEDGFQKATDPREYIDNRIRAGNIGVLLHVKQGEKFDLNYVKKEIFGLRDTPTGVH